MPVPRPLRRPYGVALRVFVRLPGPVRVFLVRRLTPSHTVGALCFLEHNGDVLMLRQQHRRGWTLPGGLVNRGETAEQAVVREVEEETGLRIAVGQPFATVVDPRARRVDVLFRVPLGARPPVRAAGEATRAGWVPTEGAGDVDEPTGMALDELRRWRAGGSHEGRLIGP